MPDITVYKRVNGVRLSVRPTEVTLRQGRQGPAGPPGASGADIVVGETPSGTINGSNATFTSANDFIPESVAVFVNGLFQQRVTDFNTSGVRTITLAASPTAGEVVRINYTRAS
mgnify:CR=1 FL=1